MVDERLTEQVILLHGIGKSSKIMRKMHDHLLIHGYKPHNINYPSTKKPVEELAEYIYQRVKQLIRANDCKLHFIGHSMGAIILRFMLQKYPLKNLGRVVMLAPPNKGSEVVDFFLKFAFFRKWFGPAAQQLTTSNNKLLEQLTEPKYEVGIIAGDYSVDKLYSWLLLDKPNDGKVTVESTKLNGSKDHIVLHASHPFIPKNKSVMQQTTYFIANGCFERPERRLG